MGLPVYVVNRRLTCRCPESATVTGRFLGYAGSHHIITYKNDLTGAIQYAHHIAIDELNLQNLPGNRSPAAKFLSGIVPNARHELKLQQAIADLTPTLSPWLSDCLVNYHVPYNVTCNVLGVVSEPDMDQEWLCLAALTPGLPAACYLGDKNIIGHYILTMNGVQIQSITDIQRILHNYHGNSDKKRGPAYPTGITILFGKPSPAAPEPDQLDFTAQDHATAQVVRALIAESFDMNEVSLNNDASLNNTVEQVSTIEHTESSLTTSFINGGGIDPRLAIEEMEWHLRPQPDDDIIAFVRSILMTSLTMDIGAPIDDIITFVQSIVALDLCPIFPKFWHHAMKDLAHKSHWIEAMFKHLDSCHAIGTFGPPQLPPANVTVLPAVIVLKMVIYAVKQINAHKVQVCLHGGHQEQGRDFEELFADTVLGQSIKICVAIACYLAWLIFHFDIHNAFQRVHIIPWNPNAHG
jgi:hypothetical protein